MMAISLFVFVVLADVIGVIVWQSSQNRSEFVHRVQRISPAQYQASYVTAKEPHVLVDVRTPEEFASGHIPGALNLVLQDLPHQMDSLHKDQPIVLHCRSGARSNAAGEMLLRARYAGLYNLGGIDDRRCQGH